MAAPVVVVLAAGGSTRLGAPKALVRLREDPPATPLALLIAAARDGFEEVLVVGGAEHAALEVAVAAVENGDAIEVVHNSAWRAGRTGSVLAAARARPGRALCLAPVDVPLVSADVFRALAAAWASAGDPATGWLAPHLGSAADARYGHPIVLGRRLLERIDPERPDRPLRELRGFADPLFGVEVQDRAILDDLDTQADLSALRARLAE